RVEKRGEKRPGAHRRVLVDARYGPVVGAHRCQVVRPRHHALIRVCDEDWGLDAAALAFLAEDRQHDPFAGSERHGRFDQDKRVVAHVPTYRADRFAESTQIDSNVAWASDHRVADIEVDVDDDHVSQGKRSLGGGSAQIRSDLHRICDHALELEVRRLERKQPGVEFRDLPVALGGWQIYANHVMDWVPIRIRGAGDCGTDGRTDEAKALHDDHLATAELV